MENQEVLEDSKAMDAIVSFCGNGPVQLSNNVKEDENPGHDILHDLDSYLEDINDRLTISRMVSDSVIKAMVNAVEQEADEKIAKNELEVAILKEALHFYRPCAHENEAYVSSAKYHDAKNINQGVYSSTSDSLLEHNRVRESLGSLRNTAEEQLEKLKKDLDKMRGCVPIRKISSGSELVGLGGILQDKESESWINVDRTLDSLKATLETVYRWVDDMVYRSKASLCEWQQEQEFQEEIKDMVIKNSICLVQEEFEGRLWDYNARIYDNESTSWHEKIKEISSLRQELDAISKTLSVPEVGLLTSHGSLEIGEECSNNKMMGNFQGKVLSNHVLPSTSLWEDNDNHEESIIDMPEFNPARLEHLSRVELINYYNMEMTNMKRRHESKVQERTEKYFSLRGKFLKEKESSSPLKKDKEFDVLRKKIPKVISKLDDILVENEKLISSDSIESLGRLKDRLDNLLFENHQLRDLLTEKKGEVNFLSSKISEASEKMLRCSLAEANLLKRIGNLQCAIEDTHIEASIVEDVYKCLLREVAGQIRCTREDSDMEYIIRQEIFEIVFKEAAQKAEPDNKCEIEDSHIESIIIQELYEVIFREALIEGEEKLNILNAKYTDENKIRVSLEMKVLEKEKALALEVAKKERLEKETLSLAASREEKDKLLLEAAAELAKEKEQVDLASQELNNLRYHTNQQQIFVSKSSEELHQALEQIGSYKVQMQELNKQIELAMERLREADEERNTTIAKLECRVAEDTKRNSLRLQNLSSELGSLIQKAAIIRSAGLLCKQKLERKSCDLQKAESEVDLLGDKVDILLGLLEKIYIALDHYSPILQLYPGVMEILKMVRRELVGESSKRV